MTKRLQDAINHKFGLWSTTDQIKTIKIDSDYRNYNKYYIFCNCDCGKSKFVDYKSLLLGRSTNCGCIGRAKLGARAKLGITRKSPGLSAFNNLYSTYKCRSKTMKLSFDLTKEQFKEITSQNCHYCGIEPKQKFKRKNMNENYLHNGIDRKDNNLGYTLENSVACCSKCNYLKRSYNYVEFISIIENIYNHTRRYNE